MTILRNAPAPVNSDPSAWPSWTDADRWELGPDGIPIAPYTAEDAEWWAEHSRDDEDTPESCPDLEDTEAEWRDTDEWLDLLAAESEAEARLTAGYQS